MNEEFRDLYSNHYGPPQGYPNCECGMCQQARQGHNWRGAAVEGRGGFLTVYDWRGNLVGQAKRYEAHWIVTVGSEEILVGGMASPQLQERMVRGMLLGIGI